MHKIVVSMQADHLKVTVEGNDIKTVFDIYKKFDNSATMEAVAEEFCDFVLKDEEEKREFFEIV